jgi:hypothetical protein
MEHYFTIWDNLLFLAAVSVFWGGAFYFIWKEGR